MLDVKLSRRRLVRSAVVAGTGLAVVPGCSLLDPTATQHQPEGPKDSRFLTIDGVTNARPVVPGRLYRSAALNRATDRGVQQLADLHLKSVVDFRRKEEVGVRVDRLPHGVAALAAPVAATVAAGPPTASLTSPAATTLAEFRAYVNKPANRQSFGAALREVAGAPDRILLWHCNSGTYRTGWATAVLLTAIGTEKDQVYADFLLSNEAFGATFAFVEYLDAGFEEANREFGSFEAYLDQGLGVDKPALDRLRHTLRLKP
jgi:protein-tyrosine phosphatase